MAVSAIAMFKSKGRGSNGFGGVPIRVRVPADLLERLAKYGNSRELTLAQTVRETLELGLDAAS